MTDDLLSGPLTAHERALVLAGVEWMRAAACGYLRADALRMRDAGRNGLPAFMELAADELEEIPPPSLQPARIGVLGEG